MVNEPAMAEKDRKKKLRKEVKALHYVPIQKQTGDTNQSVKRNHERTEISPDYSIKRQKIQRRSSKTKTAQTTKMKSCLKTKETKKRSVQHQNDEKLL